MLNLPDVTLVQISTRTPLADLVFDQCMSNASFGDNIYIRPKLGPVEDWNRYLWYSIPQLVTTSHFLVIQWDSGIINPNLWLDEFLEYDFIGAPWPWYKPPYRIGNGGFSLRSKKLHDFLLLDHQVFPLATRNQINEDDLIGRVYRPHLESIGFKYPDESLAERFSLEHGLMRQSFGYHDPRNWVRLLGIEETERRIGLATERERNKLEVQEVLKGNSFDA